MIKMIGQGPNGSMVIFGLSHENLRRLKDGQPIKVNMAELGQEGEIIIFSGETEATMQAELANLIGPTTTVKGMPQ